MIRVALGVIFALALGLIAGTVLGAVYSVCMYRRLTDRQGLTCAEGCIHFHHDGTKAAVDDGTLQFQAAVRAGVRHYPNGRPQSGGDERQRIDESNARMRAAMQRAERVQHAEVWARAN